MDLVEFLYRVGLIQGVLLAGVLMLAPSGHRQANAIMAALVLVTAVSLLQKLLVLSGLFDESPKFALLYYPLRFAWGPLLYLYALSLTGGQFSYRQWWHFLPMIVIFLKVNLSFWQVDIDQQRMLLSYLWNPQGSPQPEPIILELVGILGGLSSESRGDSLIFALQFACYCFVVIRLVRGHNRRLERYFSSLEHMTLRWLSMVTKACLIFLGLLMLFNRIPLLFFDVYDTSTLLANGHAILLVVLFYVVAIKALLQPSLLSGVKQARDSEPEWEKDRQTPMAPADDEASISDKQARVEAHPVQGRLAEKGDGGVKHQKYRASRISAADSQRYKIKLMEVMQEEDLYLDADLTLPRLAEAADLSPHQVSQVLNYQMNQNFFSFVNNYRIDLAKQLLTEPDTERMPIVELAVEVGFKSKSSFYDAFNRSTRMTPTQFKRAMNVSPEPKDGKA